MAALGSTEIDITPKKGAVITVVRKPEHVVVLSSHIANSKKTQKVNSFLPKSADTNTVMFILCVTMVLFLTTMVIALLMNFNAVPSKAGVFAQIGGAAHEDYYSDIVLSDQLSFDERISTKEQETIKEFFSTTPQDNIARVAVIRQNFDRSPESVVQQVHSIIASTNKKQMAAPTLARSIVNEALRQQYDPLFVAAVIKSESSFNELAVSNVGAQGLMQIMPATGKYLAAKHEPTWPKAVRLSDPQVNIQLGIKYLRELEDMYQGNRLLTLIAYNWGPGKLDRAIRSGRGVPAECLRYALKILKDHNYWETSPA